MAPRKRAAAKGENKEFGARPEPKARVTVNESALVNQAVYGTEAELTSLANVLCPVCEEKGLSLKGVKPQTSPPRGGGAPQNLHDIERWARSLDPDSSDKGDIKAIDFFLKILATILSRLPKNFEPAEAKSLK